MISFTVSFIRWKVVSAPAAAEPMAIAKSISSSVAVSAIKEQFDQSVTIETLQLAAYKLSREHSTHHDTSYDEDTCQRF